MKKRDRILFFLPVAAAAAVAVFTGMFLSQLLMFERAYREDTQRGIRQTTEMVQCILLPLLNAHQLAKAQDFCNNFNQDALRLSLICADGTVAADSAESSAFLGNHLERAEVRSALAGSPVCTTRYSESLNQWMTYYAIALKTTAGEYVLRAAVTTDRAARIITLAKRSALLALLLGGALVFLLTLYIIHRVRRPLHELQSTVDAIAGGNLTAPIPIPPSGLVRELAVGISAMTDQLKNHLAAMTAERNEKEALLNAMSEAVLLIAPNGDAVRLNRSALRLFDLPPAAQFNLSRSGIPELLPAVRRSFQSQDEFEKEFEMSKNSIRLTLLIRGRILTQAEQRHLLLTITDLTNQRKLESFRSDFIANVSHELKTPLTCIIGAAETIHEEPDLPKPQFDRLVTMLFEQSTRLNLLVQDILSLSALERRQTDRRSDFAPVALDAVIRSALAQAADKAAAAGITLAVAALEPTTVAGDAQLLEQAIANLLDNAIKYSESKRIDVALHDENTQAVITVRDYGVGIAVEHHPRIFERFYRVHKERSRASGGTGLGLAIVKHIAVLHNGRAELLAPADGGGGCEFRLILPRSTATESMAQ